MNNEEYYQRFTQDILARAACDPCFTQSSFVEYMCSKLEEEGCITGFTQVDYQDKRKGLAVDAWSFDEGLACLTLFLGEYRNSETLESINGGDVEKLFNRISKFLDASKNAGFFEMLDGTSPAAGLAWHILHSSLEIERVNLVVFSNAKLSSRVDSLPRKAAGGYTTTYEIWDFNRIYNIETSGKAREDVDIDFTAYGISGVPCLPAYTGEAPAKSYLLVMPGNVLSALYSNYGETLFEQNVRTFLQFRGKINKGIRNTIVNEPDMFFSYNNGISATAETVLTNEDGSRLLTVRNLQVVNGGQTTASIFSALDKDNRRKADLSKVYVQVKLCVIPPEMVDDIVPRISEYSNTQNKVNAADFFSNHPFHVRIEEFSRRMFAPPARGTVQQTRWFYERARGQYVNRQASLTPSELKKFLLENPKSQMLTKTDLAKYELCFDERPQAVSLGAQKAFSGTPGSPGFVGKIAENWAKDEKQFNELWFKEAVAKAIIFRHLDALIFKQSWYDGYKANITAYTVAKFASVVRKEGKFFDFLKIWDGQALPEALQLFLCEIAERVNSSLGNRPPGATKNIGEWAKTDKCWDIIEKIPLALPKTLEYLLVGYIVALGERRAAGRDQSILNSIEAQTYVVEKGSSYWQLLRDWNTSNRKLTLKEAGILDVACLIPRKIPTDRQAPILIAAEKRAIGEGFYAK